MEVKEKSKKRELIKTIAIVFLTVLLLLTFFFSWIAGALGFSIPVIGVILPGLLAREFDRQGFVSTGLSLAITTGATVLCVLALGV